jgi:uncharacterized membrane protein (DUF4010 family)
MDFSFPAGQGLDRLPDFAIAIAIGLLIGLERERVPSAKAGVRTFALVGLLGAIAALLSERTDSPWFLAAGLVVVGLMMIAAYLRNPDPEDSGTTTVVALLLTYGLGAMVWSGYPRIAIMLAIATTALLYFKTELQGISRGLTRTDLVSILQFAVLSFIILPLLPDRNYGPFDALNPHQIWLMVVLIVGVSLCGYLGLRIVGERYGAPLLGLLGGLVSSTATSVVYARHGRTRPDAAHLAVVVILLANMVLLVRLAVLALVAAPRALPALAPMLGAGLMLGLGGVALTWRHLSAGGAAPQQDVTNPTEMHTALSFGALYALVLFLSAWLSSVAGAKGLYAVAVVSGLTDMDAIALSSLRLFELDRLTAAETTRAIGFAVLSNMAFKTGLVFVLGGTALGFRVLRGMGLAAAGVATALILL